jgi:hypothetical protein
MTNQPFSSSGATNRQSAQETTGGTSAVTSNLNSIHERAEQKLNQLGRYIRAAYSNDEDDRWKSFKEPR